MTYFSRQFQTCGFACLYAIDMLWGCEYFEDCIEHFEMYSRNVVLLIKAIRKSIILLSTSESLLKLPITEWYVHVGSMVTGCLSFLIWIFREFLWVRVPHYGDPIAIWIFPIPRLIISSRLVESLAASRAFKDWISNFSRLCYFLRILTVKIAVCTCYMLWNIYIVNCESLWSFQNSYSIFDS